MFKFINEDSVLAVYGKWHKDDKLTFFFNKELKNVDIEHQYFERKDGCYFVPQGENGHSCKYGYWKCDAPTLSMEDIEFLHNKAKELWGGNNDL
jgi:hypothetical protein